MTPDIFYTGRTSQQLDQQARLLEDSGLSDILLATINSLSNTSFSYRDVAGIHGSEVHAGYVLRRDFYDTDKSISI